MGSRGTIESVAVFFQLHFTTTFTSLIHHLQVSLEIISGVILCTSWNIIYTRTKNQGPGTFLSVRPIRFVVVSSIDAYGEVGPAVIRITNDQGLSFCIKLQMCSTGNRVLRFHLDGTEYDSF